MRSFASEDGTPSTRASSSTLSGLMASNHVFQVASATWLRRAWEQRIHRRSASVTSASASPSRLCPHGDPQSVDHRLRLPSDQTWVVHNCAGPGEEGQRTDSSNVLPTWDGDRTTEGAEAH